MGWARFDDRYDDHEKLIAVTGLSPLAAAMHAQSITYCARHENDGNIGEAFLVRYRGLRTAREVVKAITVLVGEGLWEARGDGGWRVHDYLDFNPSRAQLESKRAADSARKRPNGAAGIPPDSTRNPTGIAVDSKARARAALPGPTHPNPSTAGGGMSESGNGEPPPGYLRSIEGGTT